METEKKVLATRRVAMLVSNACAPDRRVLRAAQALVQQGHQVTVIAWDRDWHRNRRYPPHETMDGVQIQRIGVASTYGAGLRRLGHWPGFAVQALALLRRVGPSGGSRGVLADNGAGASGPATGGNPYWHAVHCHDLDTLPIGYAYARWRRTREQVPLIFDAHESYPDLVAPRLPGWTVAGLRAMERFLVRRVDAVITVGDLLAEHYRQWARRVAVVRNCPLPSGRMPDGMRPPAPAVLRTEWGLGNAELVVCYIGGFTGGRVILPLIEAVKADASLGLVLVGEGPQAAKLLAAAEGVDRIAYLGERVPLQQVVEIMEATDVVYYGLRADHPNNHFSSPNALYSALAAGRPILTTDVGEISQVVRAQACGIVISHTDDTQTQPPTAEMIGAALAQLRPAHVRATMSRNARHAAETSYNWPAAEAELLNLYRDLWQDRGKAL